MKSFNDWLDDNVAATREKLAKKEPAFKVNTVVTAPTAPAPGGIFSSIFPTTSGVHFTANTTCIGNGLVFVEATEALDIQRLQRAKDLIVHGVTGPFPIGAYVKHTGKNLSAEPGAIARVLGYDPNWIIVQWSDDDRRRSRFEKGKFGKGQHHGMYSAHQFAAV